MKWPWWMGPIGWLLSLKDRPSREEKEREREAWKQAGMTDAEIDRDFPDLR